MVRPQLPKYQISTSYHKEYFGYTPEIKSCVFNKKRMVVLGSSLVTSDNLDHDWESPTQFLSSHLKTTLGNDWFENEFLKPENEQHIIIRWCRDGNEQIIASNQSDESYQLNGSALAYLHLAYDLFVLHDQRYLTSHMVNKLKKEPNFNGIRYELFVLATMVRAGFKLEPFDETLGQGRVTECRATHIQTGDKLQVEAKTRNVKGILGAKEGQHKNFDLYQKLRNAVEKDVAEPFIIFVDINLPELDIYNPKDKLNKIRNEYHKLEENYPHQLPNIICFTNIPFHYGQLEQPNNSAYGLVINRNPRKKFRHEVQIINSLRKSLAQYSFLPKEFEESQKFAEQYFMA